MTRICPWVPHNFQEVSPYKPETTLFYVRAHSINTISLRIAPKKLGKDIN